VSSDATLEQLDTGSRGLSTTFLAHVRAGLEVVTPALDRAIAVGRVALRSIDERWSVIDWRAGCPGFSAREIDWREICTRRPGRPPIALGGRPGETGRVEPHSSVATLPAILSFR
jgi:hypothetical protein